MKILGTALRTSGRTSAAFLLAIGLAAAPTVVTSASAAPLGPGDAADSTSDCLADLATSGCTLTGTSARYSLTVPAGMTSVGVVLRGAAGANGDQGATGGRGGLVVALVPTIPGQPLSVWLGTAASSVNAGSGLTGRADGGAGQQSSFNDDSGGGGGASAVAVGSANTSPGSSGFAPAVVAGGGGGAGGSSADQGTGIGGNGGDAGNPAGPGAAGVGPTDNANNVSAIPGAGGCANGGRGTGCDSLVGGGQPNPGTTGGAGGSPPSQAPGGGGGAGWPNGGNGGASAIPDPKDPGLFAGGGGGGGGQNFVAPGVNELAQGSSSGPNGSVTFFPTGSVQTVSCTAPLNGYRPPPATSSLYTVLVGGSGGNPTHTDWTGPPGKGAVVTGTVPVAPGQAFDLVPGCMGYGHAFSPGAGLSGGGGNAPSGADNGAGGGGGSTLSSGGRPLLVAGGGGGPGGGSASALNNFAVKMGGAGGNAGYGWAPVGAAGGQSGADGGGAPGNGGIAGSNPSQPTWGDWGSNYGDTIASGGGGGGGGGLRGGSGGGTSTAYGGGGGGSGTSMFAPGVGSPTIGSTGSGGDGKILVIPLRTSSYTNVGIALPNQGGPGFDGLGNVFDARAMTAAGAAPGQQLSVPAGPRTFSTSIPNAPVGSPDNWVANGQTIPISAGSGAALVILGASSNGPTSGNVEIHFSDGTSSSQNLALPDWTQTAPPPANVYPAVTGVKRADGASTTLYAVSLDWGPLKTPVALTLPPASSSNPAAAQMHIFSISLWS